MSAPPAPAQLRAWGALLARVDDDDGAHAAFLHGLADRLGCEPLKHAAWEALQRTTGMSYPAGLTDLEPITIKIPAAPAWYKRPLPPANGSRKSRK